MDENRENEYHQDEIDLMEIFSVLWKRKWLIVLIVILAVILALGWCMYTSQSYTMALIKLNFAGIDKHAYPDGSEFDMHDIISSDILDQAAKSIENPEHLKVFQNKPRGFVFIDPFIPVEVKEKMQQMEKQKQTYIYLPDQFYLRFIEPRQSVFSYEDKKQLLIATVSVYEEKFKKDYIDQPLLAMDLKDDSFADRDFLDSIDILNTQLNKYNAFLADRIKDAGYFRSIKSGLSFVDISNSLTKLKNIDLQEMESIVRMAYLSKKKDVLLKKYEYRIANIEKQMKKKAGEAEIAKALLASVWEKEKARYPAGIEKSAQATTQMLLDSSMLEKLTEKEYISFLIKRVLDSEVEANSLEIDREYLGEDLKRLLDASDNQVFSIDVVQQSLNEIKNEVVMLGEQANTLNQEFLQQKFTSIIKILRQPAPYTQYAKNPKLVLAVSFIVGLIVAVFLVFFMEFFSSYRKQAGFVSPEDKHIKS